MATSAAGNVFKVLVDPHNATIDIIAVHGLNPTNTKSHVEAAWTSKDKLWLRDFLPSLLPDARVLLFGYNANIAFQTSIAGVHEQAVDLLHRIRAERVHINRDRPIVFIAHSLGGIIVKRALVEAKLDDSHKSIREATYGIAFFGTPHQGGNLARLGDIAASIVRVVLANRSNSLMEALKKDSLFTESLQDNFRHQLEDYYILSFYETMGKFGLVVDKKSATLGLSGQREKQIHLSRDHSGLCKFASQDEEDYKIVSFHLVDLVRSAVKAAGTFSLEDALAQECLRALYLRDPQVELFRVEATKDPLLKDSCSWIFEDRAFLNWWNLEEYRLLWVHGDPGKGKTMMMVAVIKEISKRLQTGAQDGILSYFFCQNGDQALSSTTAVLRGLIFMLIRQNRRLIHHLQRRYDISGAKFLQGPDALYALLELLIDILKDPIVSNVYIMIDALDECDADIHQLLDHIARDDLDHRKVKWLVTSRNEPVFREQLEYSGQLHTSLELNSIFVTSAVNAFIDFKVQDLTRRKQYTSELRNLVMEQLVRKAEGTFLWVALVCKALKDIPMRKTISILQSFPAGLEPLYERMMEQLHSACDREDTSLCEQILRLVTIAARPLQIAELPMLASLPDELHTDEQSLLTLVGQCGSFLTIRQKIVYFVHQSAKEFFNTGKGKRIFRPDQSLEHRRITYVCLNLISGTLKTDICNLQRPGTMVYEIDQNWVDKCMPMHTQYACLYWLDHSMQACDDSLLIDDGPIHAFCQHDFLKWLEALSLMRRLFEGIQSIETLESILRPHESTSLLEYVADMKRLVLKHISIMEEAPLQIYASALTFSPNHSLVRKDYLGEIPKWLKQRPDLGNDWSSLLQTLEGHRSSVNSVAFSPQVARLLATAAYDSTVALWDASTGALYCTLVGHTGWVNTVSFAPKGIILASGSHDHTVRLWNSDTEETCGVLKGHTDRVRSVTFSPDGLLLASGSDDRSIRVWNSNTWEVLYTLAGHTSIVSTVAFSKDSKILASGSNDETVRLWNTATGAVSAVLVGHTDWVRSVAFSPDGHVLSSGSADGTIRLWNPTSAKASSRLMGHKGSVEAVTFSPDSHLLASGSADCTIMLWNLRTRDLCVVLKGHSNWVSAVTFSPDGELLASGSVDKTARLWDIRNVEKGDSFETHRGPATTVILSPDGQLAASGSIDQTIRLWNVGTRTTCGVLEGHTSSVRVLAFSPDGQLLASVSYEPTIWLWGMKTSKRRNILSGHSASINVNTVVFSPDGQLLASGSYDKTVRLWSLGVGKVLHILKHPDVVQSVNFSSDGRLLCSGSQDNIIRLWDPNTGHALRMLEGHLSTVNTLAFSMDGWLLASSSEDSTVRIWDVNKTRQVRRINIEGIQDMSFSIDGTFLKTNRGPIQILPNIPQIHGRHVCFGFEEFEAGWLSYNSQNIIWLAAESRPHSWKPAMASRENLLVLGLPAGQVIFLEFDPSSSLFQ